MALKNRKGFLFLLIKSPKTTFYFLKLHHRKRMYGKKVEKVFAGFKPALLSLKYGRLFSTSITLEKTDKMKKGKWCVLLDDSAKVVF